MAELPGRQAVRVKRLDPAARLPAYAHPGDAGADVFARTGATLAPGQWEAVGTGLAVEVPVGCELQVRPKSGLAARHGVTVLNAPGTIDAGYRGEVKVLLVNLGAEPYTVEPGQKIAQLILAPVVEARYEEVEELRDSARGEGGFGSTGLT